METGKPTWWDEANIFLSQDEVIGPVVRLYPNESLVGKGNLFSTLIRSIVGQQISVIAADAVWGRLVELVGEVTPEAIRPFSARRISTHAVSLDRSQVTFTALHWIRPR